MRSYIVTLVLAIFYASNTASFALDATIDELMRAVEERQDAAEGVLAEAFDLMNKYHDQVMAIPTAECYSEPERTNGPTMEPGIGFSPSVIRKLELPTFQFELVEEDCEIAPPTKHYTFVNDPDDPDASAIRRQLAEKEKENQVNLAKKALDAEKARTYDPASDRDYWKPGTSECYDYQKYRKAYYEWWVKSRKTIIETGEMPPDFTGQITDAAYKRRFPQRPDLLAHNEDLVSRWDRGHERAVSRAQKKYDAELNSVVIAYDEEAEDVLSDQYREWEGRRRQWLADEKAKAANEYLERTQEYFEQFESSVNSEEVRMAGEKRVYLAATCQDWASYFYPCGAQFVKAGIKWKYESPSNMEEAIATLNQISQHVARLNKYFVCLGDPTRFSGDFGLESIGMSGRTYSACGPINSENYREKINVLRKLLANMDALPWPMLCKRYGMGKMIESGEWSPGSTSFDFGEKSSALNSETSDASLNLGSLIGWCPYDAPGLAFGNNWSMRMRPSYSLYEESENGLWVASGSGYSCYNGGLASGVRLYLASRIKGTRELADNGRAKPPLDGKTRIEEYSNISSSFLGDHDVVFRMKWKMTGGQIDTNTEGKTAGEIVSLTEKIKSAYKSENRIIKRSYADTNSLKRLGLPETFNVEAEIFSEQDGYYSIKNKIPAAAFLPSDQIPAGVLQEDFSLGGDTFLYAKPKFNKMTTRPAVIGPPEVPRPHFGPSRRDAWDDTCVLRFPLSFRNGGGEDSPALDLELFRSSFFSETCYSGLNSMGFTRVMSLDGGGPELTVRHESSPMVIRQFLKESDGVAMATQMTDGELRAMGRRISRIKEIEFDGGKLVIEWIDWTHFRAKYFLKGDSGYEENEIVTYEVGNNCDAGRLVDRLYSAKYPEGYETVSVKKDGTLLAKAILVGGNSVVEAVEPSEAYRIEYYDESGGIEITRRSHWYGMDEIVLKDGSSVETATGKMVGDWTGGRAPERFEVQYGEHFMVPTDRGFPNDGPVIPESYLYLWPGWTIDGWSMDTSEWTVNSAHQPDEDMMYFFKAQTKGSPMDVIPFVLFPVSMELDGEGWARDGELMEFNEQGALVKHSYKLAGLDASIENVTNGDAIATNGKLGDKDFWQISRTYSKDLSKMKREEGGLESSVEYYTSDAAGGIPWAVKSIVTPGATRTFSYERVGEWGIKVIESERNGANGPMTVTETITDVHGSFVSMTKKVNQSIVASATATGHSAATLWRPTDVVFNENGVRSTHRLTYGRDGSLNAFDYGDGRKDEFKWDVFGRIKTGTKLDGGVVNADYSGLASSFGISGETTERKTDIYGTLDRFTTTSGAGLTIEGVGDHKYRTTIHSQNRSVIDDFRPDGLPSLFRGGLGAPGRGVDYEVETVDGIVCLAVTSSILNGYDANTNLKVTDYIDGYGRLIRRETPHPMAGQGSVPAGSTVHTAYSYDLAARRVTITPPPPSKVVTVDYDPDWRNTTISQGGKRISIANDATGAILKSVIKSGASEIASGETDLVSGSVTTRINGKNPVVSKPSPDGKEIRVSGPKRTEYTTNFDKFGVSSVSGKVGGKSFTGSVTRSGSGQVTHVSVKPPGAGGTITAAYNHAGQLTGASGPGQDLSVAYDYANGGEKITGSGSPVRNSFQVSSDAHGQPRIFERGGKTPLTILDDVRDGSITVAVKGMPGHFITQTYSSSGFLLGKVRSDGSGHKFSYRDNGQLKTVENFDGDSNGGERFVFAFNTDPVTGVATGYTGSQSALSVIPYPDGSTASVGYSSKDIDGQPQQYSCQYPAYFDGKPLGEVYGGLLGGFRINRVYSADTGESKRVELFKGDHLVHAVDYTPNEFGELRQVTTSGTSQFSALYDRPNEYTRKVTAGGVVATRSLATDGTAKLGSVTTKAGSGTYSATYSYHGANRKGLAISRPGGPASVWTFGFQNESDYSGQLQSASLSRGGAALLFRYNHDNIGNREGSASNANHSNQYSIVRVPGARTFGISGSAAPGSQVRISVAGVVMDTILASAAGTFSRTLPVPPQLGTIARLPISVTATLPGAGDNGTDAVARKENAVSVTLTPVEWETTYGPHGALKSDWHWSYKWDSEGRLVGLQNIAPGAANLKVKFAYDDRNRRIRKTVEYLPSGDGTPTRTVITRFVYDDWKLLAEEISDTQAGTTLKTYTWGADAFDSIGGENVIGGLVAVHCNGRNYLPVYDGNGNVIALVDSMGKEVASWERGPFGEVIFSTGETELCPFGFATAYTDSESGLVYFGHRFYSPTSGRWLSREPLGEMESFNLYAYCHNDPINKVDVLGLAERDLSLQDALANGSIDFEEIARLQWKPGQAEKFLELMELPLVSAGQVKGDIVSSRLFGGEYVNDDMVFASLLGGEKTAYFKDYQGGMAIPDVVKLETERRNRTKANFAIWRILGNPKDKQRIRMMHALADLASISTLPLDFAMSAPSLARSGTGAVMQVAGLNGVSHPVSGPSLVRILDEPVGPVLGAKSSPTPSQLARSWQGSGNYPGVDVYRDITLKKGTIIYGGEPGQSPYYTAGSAIRRAGDSASDLFQGMQVAPHPIHGYRPGLTAYEVIGDAPAAFGRALANPQHGVGGLPQIFLPDWKTWLRPIYTAPLSP